MNRSPYLLAVGAVALSFAAGCGAGPKPGPQGCIGLPVVPPPAEPSKSAKSRFKVAMALFRAHEAKSDWAAAGCQEVAAAFTKANAEAKATTGADWPMARYNAGLAHQRCGQHSEAKAHFQAALAADRRFHPAKASSLSTVSEIPASGTWTEQSSSFSKRCWTPSFKIPTPW